MRRKDQEIADRKDIDAIIGRALSCRLAMCDGDEPYIVSMSYGYDGASLYVHGAEQGKKIDVLRKNPNVWGQAMLDHGYHKGECSHLYASVMFKGKVHFIEEVEEKKHAFKVMIDQLEPKMEDRNRFAQSDGIPSTVVGYIEVEYMTGKKSEEVSL